MVGPLVNSTVVRGSTIHRAPQASYLRAHVLLKLRFQQSCGAELRAKVNHVQEGSAVAEHRVDLHTVDEPNDLCADRNNQSPLGGPRLWHVSHCCNIFLLVRLVVASALSCDACRSRFSLARTEGCPRLRRLVCTSPSEYNSNAMCDCFHPGQRSSS